MKIFLKIFAATAITSLAANSSAYSVDAKKYFAYIEKPGQNIRGARVASTLMLLSKQKCSAKGAPKTAKIGAIVYFPQGAQARETPACWYIEEMHGDEIVVLCSTLAGEMDSGSASCEFISPSRFLDVNSLPKAADF